jgi:SEL1 protein
LGIIHRDGLIVPIDKPKAYSFFQAAAGQDLAEAQVNLGKLHLGVSV